MAHTPPRPKRALFAVVCRDEGCDAMKAGGMRRFANEMFRFFHRSGMSSVILYRMQDVFLLAVFVRHKTFRFGFSTLDLDLSWLPLAAPGRP